MQNVVYEVLKRGKGDLVETGGAMYAIAPWIEGTPARGVHHDALAPPFTFPYRTAPT